jgi:hypothetical protein
MDPITTFENPPTAIGLDTNVGLYTTTLSEVDGTKTTFPLGARHADSHVPDEAIGPTLVKPDTEREYELYIPIFALEEGLMTTLPFGKRTPPPKRERPCPAIGPTFVMVSVVGLKTPIFAESLGIIMTFPVVPRTPALNL